MGWTSYNANYYKNGKIDRKAECDSLFNAPMVTSQGNDEIGKYEVVKSSMVGSVYYAAVRCVKYATKTEPETSKVFAAVCLTSVNSKDYYNFSYKDMDESCGPCERRCPKGILNLLTPTNSEWANEWRKDCYEYAEKQKSPTSLNKLPVGAKIKWTLPCDMQKGGKKGDVKILTKKWVGLSKPCWTDSYFRYSTKTIGETYAIVNQ